MKTRKRGGSGKSLSVEQLEQRTMMAGDLAAHNFTEPLDVNDDGQVTSGDALAVIGALRSGRPGGGFSDVNGDGQTTPVDGLEIIRRLRQRGPARPQPPAPAEIEFRTIDGTGNNADDPTQGAAGDNIIRFGYPAVYPDGHGDTIDVDRPNARDISNRLNAQDGSIENDRNLTDWIVQWGQFLTHDMDLSENSEAANVLSDGTTGDFNIPINDPDDPLGPHPIPFNRTDFDPETGTPDLIDSPFGPRPNWREQTNSVTSYIDASNVYGSDDATAASLREFDGGRLKISADGLLPQDEEGSFEAGDVRANEQSGLTSVHTMFVREHNRLADLISARDPNLSDEEVYQLARRIVGAEMQIITYNEFLPALLGDNAPAARDYEYDATVDASITNTFATALFRYGHSMQSAELLLVNNAGETVDRLGLRDVFFNPSVLADNPENVDLILKGLASQTAQENDVHLIDDIRSFLFGPPGAGGLDLAALDIQRGRDHGLPDYNSVRAFYGLDRVTSFDQISSDPAVQEALAELYGNVDNIDAWIGGIAEDHLPGSSVGELVDAVVSNQFERLRDGDRFFFAGDRVLRSPLVRSVIDLSDVTLADVIRQNTTVTDLQDNVFFSATVLRFDAHGGPADVALVERDGTIAVAHRRNGRVIDSVPVADLTQVILNGSGGRRGDRFSLAANVVAQIPGSVLVNGSAGRRDEIVIFGTDGPDTVVVTSDRITINGSVIEFSDIELIRLNLGGGENSVETAEDVEARVIVRDRA